jgi:hypothetical protein
VRSKALAFAAQQDLITRTHALEGHGFYKLTRPAHILQERL